MREDFGNSAAIILSQKVSKNITYETFFTKLFTYMCKMCISRCKLDLQNKS